MNCSHTRTTLKKWPDGYEGWRCKSCGENINREPKPFDEILEGIRMNQTHVEESELDLGKHCRNFRKGKMTGRQVERASQEYAAGLRQAERDGAKKVEVEGMRHTMSIPPEAYWAGRKRFGEGFLQDKKIRKKYAKHFSTTKHKE